jgi:hypothetical protein
MNTSGIYYYAETVSAGRSVLRCDVVMEGRLVLSWRVGSPAPTDVVERHVRRVAL